MEVCSIARKISANMIGMEALADELLPTRKVIVTDLRTHRVTLLEGPRDFYGHPLDEFGQVGPDLMLRTVHPDDQETFLEIAERSETLGYGEEMVYRLRARHALGHWVLAKCRTRALQWDDRGFAVTIQTEVQMENLPEA
jgi:hypothetical protein